ncbi:hypothetical protein DPMN_181631 [Dreissena polymorpha]|uniref:Apple domain-containing protein n=1 Tax=Dreissena polymorpha TaxID=45954 RepID=A0A9D4DD90_DREPO|nr:hypothetical protein DPMN_181631 [Dreissena polymorpha]
MGAGINGEIGDPNLPVLQLIQVDSVDKCKQLCLNDKLCKEASYAPTSGGQRFCYLYGSSVALVSDPTTGSAHFKKSCKTGYCEKKCLHCICI